MHTQVRKTRTRVATMSHRLMNPKTQKQGNIRFSAHYRKLPKVFCFPRSSRSPRSLHSPCSPYSPCSLAHHKNHAQRNPRASPVQQVLHELGTFTMPITISAVLSRWLLEKGFEGYIRVVEVPPHPDAQDIARKLNVNAMTNASIRKKLGQFGTREKHFEIPPTNALEKYFGE